MGATLTLPDVHSSVGRSLSDIPEVERVYVVREGNTLRVFTIVGEVNEDVYDRIYEHERSIIRDFRDAHFDFNVISLRGRAPAEVMGSILPAWQRSDLLQVVPQSRDTSPGHKKTKISLLG